jgi:hypothetical protein
MIKKTEFELAIEREMHESVESIRRTPIDERRKAIKKKTGRDILFISEYGFIGRGNVLRDYIVSHEEVEKEVDEALR